MPHLTTHQRAIIFGAKADHPSWPASEILRQHPVSLAGVSLYQVKRLLTKITRTDSPYRQSRENSRRVAPATVYRIAQLAEGTSGQPALSQRAIAREMECSLGLVNKCIKISGLKCFRRSKCNILTNAHRENRLTRCQNLLARFDENGAARIWFYDESRFSLHPPPIPQNERLYRQVNRKADIPESELLVETSSHGPALMVYAAVSEYGKTDLFFTEEKITSDIYCNTMLSQNVLPKIVEQSRAAGIINWIWQQDSAPSHTAQQTIQFLEQSCPGLIRPDEWPSRSPDLNPLDYSLWGIMRQYLNQHRNEV